jgi:hypothetical protein
VASPPFFDFLKKIRNIGSNKKMIVANKKAIETGRLMKTPKSPWEIIND